jgi:TonB family protein
MENTLSKVLHLDLQPLVQIVPPRQRRLGFFILAMLAVHGLAFYAVKVSLAAPNLTQPLKTRVILDTGSLRGSDPAQAQWLNLFDPSLLILMRDRAPAPPIPHSTAPAPLPQLSLPTDLTPSQAQPQGLAPLAERVNEWLRHSPPERESTPDSAAAVESAAGTQIVIGPGLASRAVNTLPALASLRLKSLPDSNVTAVRLGVDNNGTVRHALVEQTCGRADIDSQAVEALRGYRFLPRAETPLEWGQVYIYWQFVPETVAQ